MHQPWAPRLRPLTLRQLGTIVSTRLDDQLAAVKVNGVGWRRELRDNGTLVVRLGYRHMLLGCEKPANQPACCFLMGATVAAATCPYEIESIAARRRFWRTANAALARYGDRNDISLEGLFGQRSRLGCRWSRPASWGGSHCYKPNERRGSGND
jgi:hypothetical protein